MDTITNDKILFHLDRHYGNKEPVTAEIFLTNFCNNKCGYCRFNHSTGEYMSADLFKRILERLIGMGVQGILLTGGGEPTVNPDFDEIIEILHENDMPYGINTNFNLYKDIRPEFLKVSLDAVNAQQYKDVRGVNAYERVLRNIERFAEKRQKEGLKTVLGIQAVCIDAEHGVEFYNQHKDLPVDYIQVRPLEAVLGGSYKEDVSETIKKFEEIKKQDDRLLINHKWYDLATGFKRCYANWSVITVSWDGTVMYCCHRPDDVVGNIFDEDIQLKKQCYKADMRKCDIPCRLTGANKILERIEKGIQHEQFI